jgi:hypothetical protein
VRLARIAVALDELASEIPAAWSLDDLSSAISVAQFRHSVEAIEGALVQAETLAGELLVAA